MPRESKYDIRDAYEQARRAKAGALPTVRDVALRVGATVNLVRYHLQRMGLPYTRMSASEAGGIASGARVLAIQHGTDAGEGEARMPGAIRARARMLAASEGLAGSETRIAAAIRTTLRETTGARAVDDIQASQYEAAMQLVSGWAMAGALRRIRREREGQA